MQITCFFFTTSAQIAAWLPFIYSGSKWLPDFKMRAVDLALNRHGNLTFMGPCIVNVFKHNQQDVTLHHGIYYYKCPTCFRRFLRPSSGAQKLYTQHRVYAKLDIYPLLCVQFLSSWWWAEKPPETCRELTVIKNIVQRCVLLVILKNRNRIVMVLGTFCSVMSDLELNGKSMFYTHWFLCPHCLFSCATIHACILHALYKIYALFIPHTHCIYMYFFYAYEFYSIFTTCSIRRPTPGCITCTVIVPICYMQCML